MISEKLCDTEDWSNDAENSALHYRNKLHFKIHSNRQHTCKKYIFLHSEIKILQNSYKSQYFKPLYIWIEQLIYF